VRRATATASRQPESGRPRARSWADGQRNRSHRPCPCPFRPPATRCEIHCGRSGRFVAAPADPVQAVNLAGFTMRTM
jgi:hypothetical protein